MAAVKKQLAIVHHCMHVVQSGQLYKINYEHCSYIHIKWRKQGYTRGACPPPPLPEPLKPCKYMLSVLYDCHCSLILVKILITVLSRKIIVTKEQCCRQFCTCYLVPPCYSRQLPPPMLQSLSVLHKPLSQFSDNIVTLTMHLDINVITLTRCPVYRSCPLFRSCFAHKSMQLGPWAVSCLRKVTSFQRCPF